MFLPLVKYFLYFILAVQLLVCGLTTKGFPFYICIYAVVQKHSMLYMNTQTPGKWYCCSRYLKYYSTMVCHRQKHSGTWLFVFPLIITLHSCCKQMLLQMISFIVYNKPYLLVYKLVFNFTSALLSHYSEKKWKMVFCFEEVNE